MEKSENIYRSRKKMLFDNFLGGIVWSIGVWVGTTIVIALVVYLLSKVNYIPVIGDFVANIINYVFTKNIR
jgi:hypothetical protein